MDTTEVSQKMINDIVVHDYRTAAVFEKYSLDFCCNGGVTIEAACRQKGIDPAPVIDELGSLFSAADPSTDAAATLELDALIDHIVMVHHAYVSRMIPVIYAHTQKVASVHGLRHPEVVKIAEHFSAVAEELMQHMKKEEMILFPYIRRLVAAKRSKTPMAPSPFGSISNPIAMMEREHANAGDGLYQIRDLSSNYLPPADACTTYQVSFRELEEFERDLHRHVHLENNILFPAAVELEQSLQ
ncbi:MAG: iron-sulfur cluster repair di-iron protein [Bacteroidetes bacterium]|nr:iron-sulfur cluster repair di-iron protein [Bacteroidota bacterium]